MCDHQAVLGHKSWNRLSQEWLTIQPNRQPNFHQKAAHGSRTSLWPHPIGCRHCKEPADTSTGEPRWRELTGSPAITRNAHANAHVGGRTRTLMAAPLRCLTLASTTTPRTASPHYAQNQLLAYASPHGR